jgi:hypothetical protein
LPLVHTEEVTEVVAVNALLAGFLLLILNRCDWAGGGGKVKLAEALALRADANRRVEQLRARIVGSARFQEGEEPPEARARVAWIWVTAAQTAALSCPSPARGNRELLLRFPWPYGSDLGPSSVLQVG